jgi:hypothetical protein
VSNLLGGGYCAFASLAWELGKSDTDVDTLALLLSESAPDAVWLAGADGIVRALDANVATCTHGLRCSITSKPREASFVLGVEKQFWICFPTGSVLLPLPCGVGWNLRQRLLWHSCLLSVAESVTLRGSATARLGYLVSPAT